MKQLLRIGALVAAAVILAGCDEEPVDNTPEPLSAEVARSGNESATAPAPGSQVQPPMAETDLPDVEVREQEPEPTVDVPAEDVIQGESMHTATDDMGMEVDLLRAEIEGDELVVALRYRNTMSMDHAVALDPETISWRASGDLVQRPKADGLEPESGELSLGAGEEEVVQIRFPVPASQVETVTIEVNGARFSDIPINRA